MKKSKFLSVLLVTTVVVSPAQSSVVHQPSTQPEGFFSSFKKSFTTSVEALADAMSGLSLTPRESSFSLSSLIDSFKNLSFNRAITSNKKAGDSWETQWNLAFSKLLEVNVSNTKAVLADILARYHDEADFSKTVEPYISKVQRVHLKLVHAETDQEKLGAVSTFYQSLSNVSSSQKKMQRLLGALSSSFVDEDMIAAHALRRALGLERREENVRTLQDIVRQYYSDVDGGTLSDYSIEDLEDLKIMPSASTTHWSMPSMKGVFLLGLVASSGLIQMAYAAPAPIMRPAILDQAFPLGSSFKEGLSGFMPITFAPQRESDVTSILTFPAYQTAVQTGLSNPNGRNFALNGVRNLLNSNNMPTNCINNDGCYFGVGAMINGVTPYSNTTSEIYHFYNPGQGMQRVPVNTTTLNQTLYDLPNVGASGNFSSSLVSGSMAPYYLDQRIGSEMMSLFVVNPTQDLVVMSVMERGRNAQGPFYRLVAQRVATPQTIAHRLDLSALPSTPVVTQKPTAASALDNATFDQMSGLYSGYVDGPAHNNSRTIQQFATDEGFIPSGLIECLERHSIDPLLCVSYMGSNRYMRLSTFLAESNYNLKTVTKSVVDGPTVKNTIARQINATVVEEVEHRYDWTPLLGVPTQTESVTLGNLNPVQGTLPLNVVEKFVEIYGPNLESGAVVLHVTQTPTGNSLAFKAIPGGDLLQTVQPAPISSPAPVTSPVPHTGEPIAVPFEPALEPSSQSGSPEAEGLSTGAKVGIGVGSGVVGVGGVVGGVFFVKKILHKQGEVDIEMGTLPHNNTETSHAQLNFAQTTQGVSKARVRIKDRYFLIDHVDTEDARDIESKEVGVSFVFDQGVDVLPLVLGNGNFGKVGVVYDAETSRYLAGKFIRGNDKVGASLREGFLQHILHKEGVKGVLPLFDYLHLVPSESKAAIKQLQEAVFGNSLVQMSDGSVRDMTQEELLIQITPWATFGNGETFEQRLSDIKNPKLKESLTCYAAHRLISAMDAMHNFGVTHLDLKPENVLLNWQGDVFVADFGCARIKDKMQGGNGDYRYFSPERLKHVQDYLRAIQQNTVFKSNFSGKAADAWALGMTLLQWSIGEHPYTEALKRFNGRVAVGMVETWLDASYFKHALGRALEHIRGHKLEMLIHGLLDVDADARWSVAQAERYMKTQKVIGDEVEAKTLFASFRKALVDQYSKMPDDPSGTVDRLYYSKPQESLKDNSATESVAKGACYLSASGNDDVAYSEFYQRQQDLYQKEFKAIQKQYGSSPEMPSGEEGLFYENVDTGQYLAPPRGVQGNRMTEAFDVMDE